MASAERDPIDPRGLIRESFRMEGLTSEDCRTIFLDWALGLAEDADTASLIKALIERYADEPADHPMMAVLREGLERSARKRPSRRRRSDDTAPT